MSVILKLMGYCVKLKVIIFICLFPGFVHTREIKNHRVYGEREIQVEKFSIGVMSNEQLKTILMDRIGVNLSTDFRVVIMNRKPQIDGKLGHVVQIHVCRLP